MLRPENNYHPTIQEYLQQTMPQRAGDYFGKEHVLVVASEVRAPRYGFSKVFNKLVEVHAAAEASSAGVVPDHDPRDFGLVVCRRELVGFPACPRRLLPAVQIQPPYDQVIETSGFIETARAYPWEQVPGMGETSEIYLHLLAEVLDARLNVRPASIQE